MTNKATKYGIMIIAAVLVIAMVFAGATSADEPIIINIKDAAEWKNNVTNFGTLDDTYVINLTGNLDFEGYSTNDIVVSWNTSGCPNIEGNNHVISNFNISSSGNCFGLFGDYYGSRIANLTLSNFSVSGSYDVGGLVGRANSASHIENVHVQYGNVTGTGSVGGLAGSAGSASWVNESSAKRMYVSSGGYNVGGLVGYANSASYVKNSWVNVTEVSGGKNVGGLVGYARSASQNNASVMDCKIGRSGILIVGGLVGTANYPSDYEGCAVENCTIAGSNYVGGLVGYAISASSFASPQTSWVNATWVNGSSSVGSLFGYSGEAITTLSPGHSKVYNSTTTVNSTVSGVDNSFNGTITYSPENLSTYGIGSVIDRNGLIAGKDYGFGSVPPTPYPIHITNLTGTYQLTSAMTKVFGDDGSGYAELTNVDKATETYTLELNNFNVTKEGMSIINASVPNLTIKLVGDSNLTGNITGGSIGLLYSSGNLTITTDDDDGKLLVNNTAASGYTNAICVNFGNITIADGTVNAIATGDMGYAIYAKSGNITIADGTVDVIGKSAGISAINGNITIANGTVDATGTEYNGISVFSSGKNITIAGGTVNATGKQNGIYAISGSIIIANGTVTATATNTSSKAIFAVKNVSINGGIVTATATGTEGTAIFAEKNVVINGGVVTATGGDMGCAIFAKNDVAIENGTITATDASGFAIYARNNVTITSVAQLIANGSVASFAYGNARNFSVLGDNYAYWVNSTGSALPLIKLTYEQFDADGNWNGTTPIQSVYTNVLIKPDTTPAPAYTPSSSSHSGGSVILQPGQVAPTQQPTVAPTVKPTVKPTAIPTEKPATPTVAPTANPTAQQTQASPAPILGLIAGLGVAGLVLRLRK